MLSRTEIRKYDISVGFVNGSSTGNPIGFCRLVVSDKIRSAPVSDLTTWVLTEKNKINQKEREKRAQKVKENAKKVKLIILFLKKVVYSE
jgi:hypothetical protein